MTSDGRNIDWRTGTRCDSSACVEVGIGGDGVRVRKSRTDGPVLEFSDEEWTAFLQSAKAGEFDI